MVLLLAIRQKILGESLSDVSVATGLEALTPNLLARTIETVEGGGLVVLLLLGRMNSLRQLCASRRANHLC